MKEYKEKEKKILNKKLILFLVIFFNYIIFFEIKLQLHIVN